MLAVQQPQPQVEALPSVKGTKEVQLVRKLYALVQQVPLQEAEDQGAMGKSYGRGGVGAEGEHTDVVR